MLDSYSIGNFPHGSNAQGTVPGGITLAERCRHDSRGFCRIMLEDTFPNCEISCVEYTVEWIPHMQIVQIVLDKKLLQAADLAAKRTRRNRSALVRDALREHLRQLELRVREERDREGYARLSQADAEAQAWESEATWPQE